MKMSDVHAERAPEAPMDPTDPCGTLGARVRHFTLMCLTARTACVALRTSPIMPRTGPTRLDVRSSRGGRPERTLGEHPHVLGGRVVCRKGVDLVPFMPHPHAPAPCGRGGRACSGVQPHRAT